MGEIVGVQNAVGGAGQKERKREIKERLTALPKGKYDQKREINGHQILAEEGRKEADPGEHPIAGFLLTPRAGKSP